MQNDTNIIRSKTAANNNRKLNKKITVEFDSEERELTLDALHLTDDECGEIMDAVSDVMWAFVDLGFGVHAAQQTFDNENRNLELRDLANAFRKQSA